MADSSFSSSPSSKGKFDIKIPRYLFKQLLQHIEGSGCSYLDFKLSIVTREMDEQPVADQILLPYGKPRDTLRVECQKIVMRLKRKSITDYADILNANKIPHSSITKELLLQEEREAAKCPQPETTSSPADDDDESKASEEEEINENQEHQGGGGAKLEEGGDIDSLFKSFSKMTMDKPTPPVPVLTPLLPKNDISPTMMNRTLQNMFSPDSVPGKSPAMQAVPFNLPPLEKKSTPPFSIGCDHGSSASTSSTVRTTSTISSGSQAMAASTLSKYGIYDWSMFVLQDGTAERPTISLVDTCFPERNFGLFGIDITEATGIEHGKYTRNGFKIRLLTPSPGFKDYTLSVPKKNEYPEFESRCLILKGPSSNFFFYQVELYLRTIEEKTDGLHKSIITALRSAVTSIKIDEPSRRWAYHLIIFPVGVKLNNFIFSGDAHHVKRNRVPISVKPSHPLNPFGTKVQGMTVFWLIARDGGRQDTILNDDGSDGELDTIFDSP